MPLSKIVANSITDDTITTDQIADTSVHGRRNLIINGAMQVAQRGTSFTGVTATAYHLDRFKTTVSNDAALTVSQSTESPDEFSNSLKMDVTTADTSIGAAQYAEILYTIEAQDLQHLQYGTSTAKPITLSFWVKSSKTGTYCVCFTKQDSTRYDHPAEYTINSADTWEKKTITVEPDSNIKASGGAIANDSGHGMVLKFVLAAGSNRHGTASTWTSSTPAAATSNQVNWLDSTSNDFYLTGVQLEVGDKATPFEHRSFGEELTLCHRYAIRYTQDNNERGFEGSFGNGTNTRVTIKPYVPMRATPTMTVNDDGESLRDFVAWYDASNASLLSSSNNEFISVGVVHADTGLASGGNTVAWWGGFDIVLDAEL